MPYYITPQARPDSKGYMIWFAKDRNELKKEITLSYCGAGLDEGENAHPITKMTSEARVIDIHLRGVYRVVEEKPRIHSGLNLNIFEHDNTLSNISILGIPGTGKTTTAKQLNLELDIPFYEEPYRDNPYLNGSFTYNPIQCNLWMYIEICRTVMSSPESIIMDTSPDYCYNLFNSDKEKEELGALIAFFNEQIVGNDRILPYPDSDRFYIPNQFALVADLETIRDRIIKRDREGFVETELNLLETRWDRFSKFLNQRPDIIQIDACQSVENVVSSILEHLH